MPFKFAEDALDSPEKRRTSPVAVIGCGRVGLQMACLFANSGFFVACVDGDHYAASLVKEGKHLFTETQWGALIKRHMDQGHLTASTDIRHTVAASPIIIFTVQPQVNKRGKPDYSSLEKACREVGRSLSTGSLIIVHSTVGPGITEALLKETLENASGLQAGIDFSLAYSPIPLLSDGTLEDIAASTRIVGAINQHSLDTACLVLSLISEASILQVRNIQTAEAAKLFETGFLAVNFALANELARFCEKKGIDFVEARDAANTQAYCDLQKPELVGGQIVKATSLLTEEAEEVSAKSLLLQVARKTNDELLEHILRLTKSALRMVEKTVKRAQISVFGVSCRPNMKEPQGSVVRKLVARLRKKGAKVRVYDSLFSYSELQKLGYPAEPTLAKTVEGADCIIIAVGHDRFQRLNLGRIKVLAHNPAAIVDVGNVVDPRKAEEKGFFYCGLGRGTDRSLQE